MSLARRDEHLVELMDDPDCDPGRLAATYRRFGLVNRLVSGWGTVWRRDLAPYLRGLGRPVRVLDLGSGGGDLAGRLARAARRDGVDASFVGADPDPRAHAAAQLRAPQGVEFVCTDAAGLTARGEVFDAVVSNHVVHHLDAVGLRRFAEESRALSRGIVVHSDIARGRAAYALYGVGIVPLAPGTFLRTDGLRSIRRSYRREELAATLGTAWTVRRAAPFRLLATATGRA